MTKQNVARNLRPGTSTQLKSIEQCVHLLKKQYKIKLNQFSLLVNSKDNVNITKSNDRQSVKHDNPKLTKLVADYLTQSVW